MMLVSKELIIVPSTTTDTVTMLVKHNALNKNDINRTCIGLGLRLRHTITPLTHHVLAVIGTNLHRVTMGNREKKCFLVSVLSEQRTQVHLIMNRIKEKHRLRLAESRHLLYLRDDTTGLSCHLFGCHDTTLLLDQRAKSLLLSTNAHPREPLPEIVYL